MANAAIKAKVKERIERTHLQIMRHADFCAWAGLLYVGKWDLEDDPAKCPTAYVDMAGNTKYGTDFLAGFKPEGGKDVYVNWVVLHENGHKAFLHLSLGLDMFKEHQVLANIAADHVVNLAIYDTDPQEVFAKHPRDENGKMKYAFDPKYRGWSMREIFNDLKQQMQQQQKQGEGQGDPMDGHGFGEGNGQPMTKEEEEKLQKEIKNALRQGQYLASKNGSKGGRRLVGDVLQPKVDWRAEMQQFLQDSFVGDDYSTWRKPLRRFVGMDTYLPSSYSEEVGELVAGIDTSGSTGERETVAWTSEIFHLCRLVRPKKLRLLYWGSGIVAEEVYTPDQYDTMLSVTKPVDGGGTDVSEVAEYVKKNPQVQAAIILTDGDIYGGFGEWDIPTLWVITNKRNVSPVGKTIHMEV